VLATCENCGDMLWRDNAYRNEDGDDYCENCYSDIYTMCDRCNSEIARDDASYNDDGCYCESCYIDEENKAIHDHDYKPDAVFFHEAKPKDDLYFGFELEVENKGGNNNEEIAEYLINKYPFLYCKFDGSLVSGFEIVSHP